MVDSKGLVRISSYGGKLKSLRKLGASGNSKPNESLFGLEAIE